MHCWKNGEIMKTELSNKTTIFTVGDSLVQTYTEDYAPMTGWGQMLPIYFNEAHVVVKNHAIGGRSSGSFLREGRFDKVLQDLQPGDYVLIEFGHNDATWNKPERYVPVLDFKANLTKHYIAATRQCGGIPILITLVNRNDYDPNTGKFNVSFPEYVQATREVAAETAAPLIDLNAMTVEYFDRLNHEYGIGATETKIFNHAKPGEYAGVYANGVADNTHLQKAGAMIVAGMVAKSFRTLGIDKLARWYREPESYNIT